MILVAARLPAAALAGGAAEVAAATARLTGLSLADVSARLAGPLPRVLQVEADPDRAATLAAGLEAAGFGIIVCDPRAAAREEDRLQARTVRFGEGNLLIQAEGVATAEHEVPLRAVTLIQRGVRTTTATTVTTTHARKLDLGRALLTGGLMLTKKVAARSTATNTSQEGFLLLHRGDGERDVMISERRIDYRFLGTDLQPSSAGNFQNLTTRLRAAAPGIPYDDRVSRPGLVAALPVSPAVALDVALWLVHLIHLRGFAAL